MKAAILLYNNAPLKLVECQPDVIYPGQVLVQVLATGICGAQLQEIRGEKGTHFPRFMGHEGCGRVVEVGPGVTKLKVGEKVVMHWRKGNGAESRPPEYVLDGKVITSGQVTTFSEYSICSENRLTAVPDETPNELCALLGCGLSTALGTIENEANLLMGESILIVGCGGLGLNLIRAARMRLAGLIIGLDSVREKEISALESGADIFFHHPNAIGLRTFDVIVDTTGNPEAIENAMKLLAPSGRFIMVGQPKGECWLPAHGTSMFEGNGKTIKATQGGCFNPAQDIPRYVNLWKSGQMRLDGIITHRLKLEQINEGIELVKNGQAGRVIIEP